MESHQTRYPILEIRQLHAEVEGKTILHGINLTVYPGEVHAIMGPNGSGKSTLAGVLVGHPAYKVLKGEVIFCGRNLLELKPEERAREGLFLAFQYPVELPGVSTMSFLRAALNQIRHHRGLDELDPTEFISLLREKAAKLDLDENILKRSVNEGFSGGERKRNEILQMAVLEPKLAILDEPDSGLDIDALKLVASNLASLRRPDSAQLIITHYQRLLSYIEPDYVHVLVDGRIVISGDKSLAHELEQKGYGWVTGTPSI